MLQPATKTQNMLMKLSHLTIINQDTSFNVSLKLILFYNQLRQGYHRHIHVLNSALFMSCQFNVLEMI